MFLVTNQFCSAMQPASCIIQNIDELRPYYQAICQIQEVLKQAARENGCDVCYDCWPQHDPYCYRTPKYMFLGTSISDWNGEEREVLCILYTPFGRVKLLAVGWLPMHIDTTKEFLAKMNWEIEDVTERVDAYHYKQNVNVPLGPFSMSGCSSTYKIYLVKSVGSIDFCPENKKKYMIFDNCRLIEGQEELDKKTFEELSTVTDIQ